VENLKSEQKKIIKSMSGVVTSDKLNKTRSIVVEYKVMHPLYKKYVVKSKKFKAHDETNQSHIGDFVRIESTKPISKEKKWIIKEIITKAK
jgi:small subunit ribosomal protein S17